MRTLQVIWGGLVAGVVLYTGAALAVMSMGLVQPGVLDPGIMNPVGAATLAYMIGGVFVRRALLARIRPDAPADARLAAYQTATILGLALSESGGLILITLGMLAGARGWVLVGGASAAVLMLMGRPQAEDLG